MDQYATIPIICKEDSAKGLSQRPRQLGFRGDLSKFVTPKGEPDSRRRLLHGLSSQPSGQSL